MVRLRRDLKTQKWRRNFLRRHWWNPCTLNDNFIASFLDAGADVEHGVVEAEAKDLGEEVDGVTGKLTLWPPPIVVF